MSSLTRKLCLPCINSTFTLNLNWAMHYLRFISSSNLCWFLPRINSTPCMNNNRFMYLKQNKSNDLRRECNAYTSVALCVLRWDVAACQVSIRLLPWTWMGRWMRRCLVVWGILSDVCQVSTRLCPIIWAGLCIYITIMYTHWLRKRRFIPQ
jgi:hypothetical protein